MRAAVIEATTVRQPLRLAMSVAPSRWTHRLLRSLGAPGVRTEDPAFDAAWRVTASDASPATQLLDARCRAALSATSGTAVTYKDGEVVVRVAGSPLRGTHVLLGIEIALALATAQVTTTAYR
jgi:hypothetical protein